MQLIVSRKYLKQSLVVLSSLKEYYVTFYYNSPVFNHVHVLAFHGHFNLTGFAAFIRTPPVPACPFGLQCGLLLYPTRNRRCSREMDARPFSINSFVASGQIIPASLLSRLLFSVLMAAVPISSLYTGCPLHLYRIHDALNLFVGYINTCTRCGFAYL